MLLFWFVVYIGYCQSLNTCAGQNVFVTEEQSYSSSVIGMIPLLSVEEKLIDNLEDYAELLQQKLDTIRFGIAEMRLENEKSQQNPETYLSNPINAFALIRHLHADWLKWQLFMDKKIGQEHIDFIEKTRPDLPTATDLVETAESIERIRATYNLSAADMANGLLAGIQYDVKFSSLDTFAIGIYFYNTEKYLEAESWINVSYKIFNQSSLYKLLGHNIQDICKLNASVQLALDDQYGALQAIELALLQQPFNAKLLERKSEIENLIRLEPRYRQPVSNNSNQSDSNNSDCILREKSLNKLHCRYNHTTTPFLKLAPLKMEEVLLNPYIVVYHDVFTDNEIAKLRNISTPLLKRSKIFDIDTNTSKPHPMRVSKAKFLQKELGSDLAHRLDMRYSDMSGLDMTNADMIQVVNYGTGGFYSCHYDFFGDYLKNNYPELGDRIVTILTYMTDVEQGGATSFPYLNVQVYPKKGNALMWYNLDNTGLGMHNTAHTSCPVIVGSKWSINKWVRDADQMFLNPCQKHEN